MRYWSRSEELIRSFNADETYGKIRGMFERFESRGVPSGKLADLPAGAAGEWLRASQQEDL